jgi:hypothetical protein
MQGHSSPFSRSIASRKLSKAVTLLNRAGQQLDVASRNAPDRYNADRLRIFAAGLRNVAMPLSRLANRLEKGGAR